MADNVTEFPSEATPAVLIDVKLYPGFTVEQGVEALAKIAKGLSSLLNIGIESGILTPANPIAGVIWQSAANLDNVVQQLEQHKRSQSGLLVPGAGPQRIV